MKPSSPDSKRTFRLSLLAAAALLLASARAGSAQGQKDAVPGVPELKRGEYARAVELLSARLGSNPSDAEAQKNLLRAYLETGRYAETETSARRFLTKQPAAAGVRHELAEALAATGRYSEAVTEFERAAKDAAPSERLTSELRRGELLKLSGQEAQAREIFNALARYYEEQQPETAAELTAVARALVHLEKYQDAKDLFTEAIDADATYVEAHLGGGRLFTEKYNYAEAAEFYEDALKINPNSAPAHVGVAANKRLEGGLEMFASLARALEINPNHVEALALKAGLALESGEHEAATTDIERALKVNPRAPEVHALRAAQSYLQDRDFEPAAREALAVNPRYGELYDTLAHYATITRRTAQAAEFARRAIALSPRLWRAHLSLGMALLRLGQMDEGRASVERAFEGDPFNVWAKNTLDLLDAMRDFRETRRGAFVIRSAAGETEVLAPLAADLLALEPVLATLMTLLQAAAERRREWREILAEQHGLPRDRLNAFFAAQRLMLNLDDRRALLLLLRRGGQGSSYPSPSLRFLEPDPTTE